MSQQSALPTLWQAWCRGAHRGMPGMRRQDRGQIRGAGGRNPLLPLTERGCKSSSGGLGLVNTLRFGSKSFLLKNILKSRLPTERGHQMADNSSCSKVMCEAARACEWTDCPHHKPHERWPATEKAPSACDPCLCLGQPERYVRAGKRYYIRCIPLAQAERRARAREAFGFGAEQHQRRHRLN